MEEAVISQSINEQPTEVSVESQENENGMQNEGQEAAQEVTKPEPPKEEPIPKGVQKRIDRAVRQKYEAEARANELERRLREVEQQTRKPVQQATEGEPKLEQFDNIEDYVAAKAAFVADQRIQHTLTTRERAEAEQRAQAAQKQTADSWNKRVQLATAELPDFEEVVRSIDDILFTEPAVPQAILESDIGPKIVYYLASNPNEAEQLAQLRGLAAVRAIGRIEAKLELGKVSTTKAPPPIEPAGVRASATKSPEDMTPNEFAAWRKKFISSRSSR